MTELHKRRFSELMAQMEQLWNSQSMVTNSLGKTVPEIDADELLEWRVKTRNLIVASCGPDSEHYQSFVAAEKTKGFDMNMDVLRRLRAVFVAAKEDYEGGYIRSLRGIVQAELLDSELEQAQELLSTGYIAAAAVIGGVVLETTMRELCDQNSISHGKLDKMNADLAKANVITKLQQKRNTALAAVRNATAHGKLTGFSDDDVKDMLRDVERFVTEMIGS